MKTKEKNIVKRYQDCIDVLRQTAAVLQGVDDRYKPGMALYLKGSFADIVEAAGLVAPDMHNLPIDLQKVRGSAAAGVEACEKLKRYVK